MAEYNFFDTRNDRLARDIRNKLGKAFVKRLAPDLDLTPVAELAENFLAENPGAVYENYIRQRLAGFHAAKQHISQNKINDNYYRALVLWDHELFFETHEILESLWMKAAGSRKLILQALIRAAGVYIHLANHNQNGAEKMAAKARETLTALREEVPPFPGLEKLLDSLANLEHTPPKLLSDSGK
ncbi:MAG: DUF309 domain-containing protein [Thermodesulfobacteriota bacterium]